MSPTTSRAERSSLLALWACSIAVWGATFVIFFWVEPGSVGQFFCFLLIPIGGLPLSVFRQFTKRLRDE